VIELHGGQVVQQAAITSANIREGASLKHSGGAITTCTINPKGELDATTGSAATITNTVCYAGFILRDPTGKLTFTNGIDFVGCTPASGLFDVVPSRTWTPTAL